MPTLSISLVLQLVVALGLLNVWVIRSGKATAYRGGESQSLKGEFAAYGLPEMMFYLVGGLKIVAALAFIAGIWWPALVVPAAAVVVVLMLGAIAMHVKVSDPLSKSMPAASVLILSAAILVLNL